MEANGYRHRQRPFEPTPIVTIYPQYHDFSQKFCIQFQVFQSKISKLRLLNGRDITESEIAPILLAEENISVFPWELWDDRHIQSTSSKINSKLGRFTLPASTMTLDMLKDIFMKAQSYSSMTCPRVSGVCVNILVKTVLLRFKADEGRMNMMECATMNAQVRKITALERAVDQLEKKAFDSNQEITQCMICFDDFEKGMQVTSMPCKHVYHGKCIQKWLEESPICPVCRFKIPIPDDQNY